MTIRPRFLSSCSRLAAIAALASVAWTGCDKEESAHAESATAAQPKADDPAAINAAVPENLRAELSFEAKTAEDGKLAAIVPAGWTESEYIPGKFTPPDGSGLGIMSRFDVGANCDGMCAAKDWAATVEKAEFGRLTGDAGFTITKDEKIPGGRLLIGRTERATRLVAAWWKEGASQYYVCRASLDGKAAEAIDAFERACRATRVLSW